MSFLYAVFAAIAQVFSNWAQELHHVGTLVEGKPGFWAMFALAFYDMSIICSNIGQLLLAASTLTMALEERLDDLEIDLASFIETFSILDLISGVWDDFEDFLADKRLWVVNLLVGIVPDLEGFFDNPIDWLLTILSNYLPLDYTPSGFRIEDIGGTDYWVNDQVKVGEGFSFTSSVPYYDAAFVDLHGVVPTDQCAELETNAPRVSHYRVLSRGMLEQGAFLRRRIYPHKGVPATAVTVNVTAITSGGIAFKTRIWSTWYTGCPYGVWILVSILGPTGEGGWDFDWSIIFNMTEDFFLGIRANLYALCEHVLRYFFEGVW